MTSPEDTVGRVVAIADAEARCYATTCFNAERKLQPTKRHAAGIEPLWPLPRSNITTSRRSIESPAFLHTESSRHRRELRDQSESR